MSYDENGVVADRGPGEQSKRGGAGHQGTTRTVTTLSLDCIAVGGPVPLIIAIGVAFVTAGHHVLANARDRAATTVCPHFRARRRYRKGTWQVQTHIKEEGAGE